MTPARSSGASRSDDGEQRMKGFSGMSVVIALAAAGWLSACVTMPAGAAPGTGSLHTSDAMPDIGTKMPDGTVYAGLSMTTGKPSFVAAAGGRMPDGTIYAGISPGSGNRMYPTPADAPDVYTWSKA